MPPELCEYQLAESYSALWILGVFILAAIGVAARLIFMWARECSVYRTRYYAALESWDRETAWLRTQAERAEYEREHGLL